MKEEMVRAKLNGYGISPDIETFQALCEYVDGCKEIGEILHIFVLGVFDEREREYKVEKPIFTDTLPKKSSYYFPSDRTARYMSELREKGYDIKNIFSIYRLGRVHGRDFYIELENGIIVDKKSFLLEM